MVVRRRAGGAGVFAFLLACLLHAEYMCSAFYLPGIKPHSFKEDEDVPMKVNSMTSVHTQLPKDYYALPFCRPSDGVEMASENLGEFLTGNKIENSAYSIQMLRDGYCTILCQKKLDALEARKLQIHVKFGYHNNWIIDNLPSAVIVTGASVTETENRQRHYAGGFPIGYVLPKAGADTTSISRGDARVRFTPTRKFWEQEDAYIYNHVNLNIDYHKHDEDGYRVVGFAVEPMSIKHTFLNNYQWDGESHEGYQKTLGTCPHLRHMTRGDVVDPQVIKTGETIIFTYDVIWKPSDVQWASRWDVYLSEDHIVPAQVHWYSINNSLLVVVSLSVLVASILVRNLRRDIAGYNAAANMTDEEKEEEMEEKGWKLLHADVFRPPLVHPMLFCVFVGSGVQIIVACLASILLSAVGFLNPARRGSLMIATLIFYMICGALAGFVSARFYKSFRGRKWQMCTLFTAIAFPGLCFSLFLLFNIVLYFFHSSGSVPFVDVLILASMWCCVSIPLVFVGGYFGYKQDYIAHPTVTSSIARVVPEPSFILNPKLSMLLAGIMPFSAAFVEVFFIMTSLWMDQFYYVFGFTFIVFLIILITCSEVTILLCYYQFCAENHRWWWFSFVTAGSTGFYLFAYSCFWFSQLEASKMLVTHMLYFGYMFLISAGMFLCTGSVGFLSCFWFTQKIFGSIKVD